MQGSIFFVCVEILMVPECPERTKEAGLVFPAIGGESKAELSSLLETSQFRVELVLMFSTVLYSVSSELKGIFSNNDYPLNWLGKRYKHCMLSSGWCGVL